eukprot:957982-Prorocentrum_minimum.AAC.1
MYDPTRRMDKQVTGEGLRMLAPLKALKSLRLSCCSQVTNEGLQALVNAHLRKLSTLCLEACEQ